jgi:CheY-like chemotaxis protein
MRILVIDDNRDIAGTLAELLRIDGHEDVAVAYDAVSALALMRVNTPEFVLCDLMLPGGMDGRDLARTCRNDEALRNVRLVAMSGYCSSEDRLHAIAAGFDDLLGKPLRFETLTAFMRQRPAPS